MIERTEAEALLDTRVRVEWGGEPKVALLRAVTPNDVLILAASGGVETLVPLGDVRSIEDARFACRKCGDRVNRVFGRTAESTGLCAECTREWAAQQPVPHEHCEVEGCGERAVYSPLLKHWWCARHRAEFGVKATGQVAAAVAVCRSADKDSPLHDWKQMKSQWVCRTCKVKVFGKPKFA